MKKFSKAHLIAIFLGIFWHPVATSRFENQTGNGILNLLKEGKVFDVTRRVDELLKKRNANFVTDAVFLIKKAIELSPNLMYGLHDGIDFKLIANVTNLINKIYLDHIFDNVTAKASITFYKIGLARSDIETLSSQFANHTLQHPHRLMLLEKIVTLPPFKNTPCLYNGSSTSFSSNSELLSEKFKLEISEKYGSQVIFGIDLMPEATNCEETPTYLQSPHTKIVVLTFIMQMTYFYDEFWEEVVRTFRLVSYVIDKFNPDARVWLRIATPIFVGDVTFENHVENQILLAEYSIRAANALVGPVVSVIDFFNLKFQPEYVNIMKRQQCFFMNHDKFSELLIENSLRGGNINGDEEKGIFGVAFDHHEVDNEILGAIGPIWNPMKLTSEFKSAELRTKLQVMPKKFKNILMSYGTIEKIIDLLEEENSTIYQQPIFSKPTDVIVSYEDSLANEDSLIKTLSNLVKINEKSQDTIKITAFVLNDIKLINASRWDVVRNLTNDIRQQSENNSKTKFGFSTYLGNILDSTQEQIINTVATNFHFCNAIFQPCDILIWKFSINPFSFQFDKMSIDSKYTEVGSTLSFMMKLRSYILRVGHPEFQVIVQFEWDRLPGTKRELVIYCDSDVERNLNVINGMMMWTLINKIPVITMTAFQDMMRYGWWQNLLWAQTTFQPDSLLYIGRNEVPCIMEDTRPITSEIRFNLESTGISMFIDLKNDSKSQAHQNDFKTMLRFAAKKFQIIDIILNPNFPVYDLLNEINNTLSTAMTLPEVEESAQIPRLKLYFTIPFSSLEKDAENTTSVHLQTSKLSSIIKQSAPSSLKSKLSFKGFTITNVSSTSSPEAEKLMSRMRTEGVPVGYFLKDCMLIKTETLPEYEQHLVTQSSYAICDSACNYTIESTFLDYYFRVLLTIQRRFTHYFPKAELIFRIKMTTPRALKDEDKKIDEKYLRFWHEFNKFSNAHKIHYFLYPAFDKRNGEGRGWWKIDDYSDLSNTSAYHEKESEFLGEETWRPEDKPESLAQNTSLLMILLGTLFTLLVSSFLVFTLVVVRLKRRNLLRSDEADEFFNGSNSTSSSGSQLALDVLSPYVLAGVNTFLKEKYDDRFEIPKKEIEFGSQRKILGQGNFGAVYEAVWKGNLVAVKIPHARTDKETFKSMLAEVKIMSCMGVHINVLTLLGAYTGEIRSGKLYIVTELCKNGSLQDYLRGLNVKLCAATPNPTHENVDDVTEEGSNEDLQSKRISNMVYELWQFSQEIACGMDYIAGKKVVHGDLSTRNVLLNEDMKCKISDFGLSRRLYECTECIKNKEAPMPWRWMAIETLKRFEFSTKADVWSYGVTLWEIFSLGVLPYPGLEWSSTFVDELISGLRMSKPEYASDEIYNEILKTWNENPEERPTFVELVGTFRRLRSTEYDAI